jgi:hypothetical protein
MEQAGSFLSSCIRGGDARRKRAVCLLPLPPLHPSPPETPGLYPHPSLRHPGCERGRIIVVHKTVVVLRTTVNKVQHPFEHWKARCRALIASAWVAAVPWIGAITSWS